MDWYFAIAWLAIISQLLFLGQIYRNRRYALAKIRRKRTWYRPRTLLIVPCKGTEPAFETNIASFFNQDYENYLLWFVVAEKSDPAYQTLCGLKQTLAEKSKTLDVQILVAGPAQSGCCSQKIHNLLYCCSRAPADVEILAFADSDVCVSTIWLSHLVYPLKKPRNGAATGYRWFVPKKNNLATIALSAVNAKIAQLLGDTIFNQAWGGSMAVRLDDFKSLGLDKIWQKSLSDDLSLSSAVKKTGMKVAFVPACLVASYEQTTWRKLLEFGRRQFLITRIYAPGTWWFGLLSSLYSVLGLWAGAAIAVYALLINDKNAGLYTAVPLLFLTCQFIRAVMRQMTAANILIKKRKELSAARLADIFGFWIWSWLLLFMILSSAFGNTITWKDIRYKILSPTETIIVS